VGYTLVTLLNYAFAAEKLGSYKIPTRMYIAHNI